MKPTPEDIYSPKGQDIRDRAKALTAKKQKLYQKGRLGIVIDGTGKDVNKIKKQISQFQKIGYEIAMIFVNTDLDTALLRNRQRARTLPDKQVKDMWLEVQKNIGAFQRMFGQNFFVVDNSEGSNWNQQTTNVYKKISDWSKKPANTKAAKDWIKAQRNMSESLAVGFNTPHGKRSDFRNLILKYLDKKVKSDKSNRQSLRGHILDIKRSVNTDLSVKEIERLYNTMRKRGLTEGKYTDEMRAKLADKIAAHNAEIQKQIDAYKKMTPDERKSHNARAAEQAKRQAQQGQAELAKQQQSALRLRPGQHVPGTGRTVIFKSPALGAMAAASLPIPKGGANYGQQVVGGSGAFDPNLGSGVFGRSKSTRESYDHLYEEEAGAAPSNTAASAGIPDDTANMGPRKKKKKISEILRRYNMKEDVTRDTAIYRPDATGKFTTTPRHRPEPRPPKPPNTTSSAPKTSPRPKTRPTSAPETSAPPKTYNARAFGITSDHMGTEEPSLIKQWSQDWRRLKADPQKNSGGATGSW